MHNPEQQANTKLLELLEIARRNTAIADMLKFKRYVPSTDVLAAHTEQYRHFLSDLPLKWYHIPNVGRYNSFELKFDRDWNWLISAIIEMKKYDLSHKPGSKLERIYEAIRSTRSIYFNLHELWTLVSDYALELLRIKELEKQKHTRNQS
jgi:hypothetical protein